MQKAIDRQDFGGTANHWVWAARVRLRGLSRNRSSVVGRISGGEFGDKIAPSLFRFPSLGFSYLRSTVV